MLPLEGRTIALPESRELDRLAELVEHDGGKALRCPLVAILDAPDQGPSEAWLRALVAGELDDVIFLTGEGPGARSARRKERAAGVDDS